MLGFWGVLKILSYRNGLSAQWRIVNTMPILNHYLDNSRCWKLVIYLMFSVCNSGTNLWTSHFLIILARSLHSIMNYTKRNTWSKPTPLVSYPDYLLALAMFWGIVSQTYCRNILEPWPKRLTLTALNRLLHWLRHILLDLMWVHRHQLLFLWAQCQVIFIVLIVCASIWLIDFPLSYSHVTHVIMFVYMTICWRDRPSSLLSEWSTLQAMCSPRGRLHVSGQAWP